MAQSLMTQNPRKGELNLAQTSLWFIVFALYFVDLC